MQNFMQKRSHLAVVLGTVLVTLSLVACGGGSGGGSSVVTPPQPTSFTESVTCPSGEQKSGTGTTQTAAIAAATDQCPAPTLLSITPANGDTSASPDAIAASGIVVSTSSALRVPNVADLSFTSGQTTYPGTTTVLTPKSFKFVPTAKLLYGTVYTFVASLYDGLGKPLSVRTTFTTSPVQCVAPQVSAADGQSCVTPAPACTPPSMTNSLGVCMSPPVAGSTWNTAVKAWVYPIGVKVVGANQVPVGCVSELDQCWLNAVANGTVKWIATPAVATGATSGRDGSVMFAYFMNGSPVTNASGPYSTTLFFAATGIAFSNHVDTGVLDVIDWVAGSVNGLIMHVDDGRCFETTWHPLTTQAGVDSNVWSNTQITCPAL